MALLIPRMIQCIRSDRSCLKLLKASTNKYAFIRSTIPASCLQRCFCNESKKPDDLDLNQTSKSNHKPIKPSVRSKFSAFSDEENEIVLDMQEEMMSQNRDDVVKDISEDGVYLYQERHKTKKSKEVFELNLERGKDGVFDMIDLIQALKLEQVTDVVVISIPAEMRYCDFLVIGTVKNGKHMTGTLEFLGKLHKLKKSPEDPFLHTIHDRQYDHRKSPWQVLDFHNIVLHLFEPDSRRFYDLETLWTVGPEFDDQTVRPAYDSVVDMMQKHLQFIETLAPDNAENVTKRA